MNKSYKSYPIQTKLKIVYIFFIFFFIFKKIKKNKNRSETKTINKVGTVTKYLLGIKKIKNPFDISFDNFNIILPNKNTFIADPFLFKYKDEYYAFFEEWNYNYGYISCSKLDKDLNFTKIEKVLDTKSHLSFPSIFEYKEDIYMIPESSAGGRGIDIYKCINFPLKWEKEKTIHNIEAVDPIFYSQGDIIYIFAGSINHFKIYYSNDLFGDFKEHPINSKNFKNNSRSAGNIFSFQENLYRPAQICEPSYGYGVALYRIDLLDTESYKETLIKNIKPDWFPELTGTHTFNVYEGLLIIDGRLRVETPFKEYTGKVWKSTDNDDYVDKHISKLNIEYIKKKTNRDDSVELKLRSEYEKNNSICKNERVYLEKHYFNKINGEMLFVGVADYTVSYYSLNPNLNFTTVEFVKERDIYGSPYKHFSGDFLQIDENKKYDYINLFGVLGHKEIEGRIAKYNMFTLENVLEKSVRLLNYNGHIMIGPAYRQEKEFGMEYWNNQFSEIKYKYDILLKIIGPNNIIAIIKPKKYLN